MTQIENRVNEIDGKIAGMDQEINSLYMKLRSSRGNQKSFLKQRLVQLLKRRKMMGNQMGTYFNHQAALENVAFTQESIQNTMEMAQAMKQGYEANMTAMKKVDVDALQDIKDNMQDMMWECEAINDALNYDMDDVDEDDIDDELADIENDLKLQGLIEPAQKHQQGPAQNKIGGLTN